MHRILLGFIEERYDVYDGNANGDGLFLTNDTG